MRILPVRADHGRGGSAQENPQANRRRYRREHGQHLSLRNLLAYPAGYPPCGRAAGIGRITMSAKPLSIPQVELDRRDFLVRSAAVRGAMVLGFYVPSAGAATASIDGQPWYRDAISPEL